MKTVSNILIVDDELFGRRALGGLLAGQGYNLLFASSGLETLDVVKENIPDLILLDVMMPDMDGFEVCRHLRADNLLSDIPIVMVTALDDPQSRLQGLEAGADDFITKPFNGLELRARIRTITRLNRYRRLLSERAKFEQTVEFSPNGIIIINLNGIISLINPAMLRMLAIDKENINLALGQSLFQFVEESFQEKCHNILDKGQKSPVLNQELNFVSTKGICFPAEVDIGGFLLEDKGMLQVVVRDITEKKKLESMLLRTQRQEILGTISGSIAHDLRNILTPILIATEMLEKQLTDDRGKRFTSMIKRNGNHGVLLTQQILKFSKGIKPSTDAIELNTLIEEIREIISITLSKTISMTTEVPQDLWPVIGDATQLHQVILNLCVNARDAMPEGGKLVLSAKNIFLEASIDEPTKTGNYVAISITDTGTGISSENLVHIFEPFFTTKSADKGTGLGLFTVQSIVRNHNGFLKVNSEVNKGTTFTVYIPALKAIDSEETMDLALGHGELILIINDEASLGGMIKETLASYGYTTLMASSLTDIIACYDLAKKEDNPISVVLLDISTNFSKAKEILFSLKEMDRSLKIITVGNETFRDSTSSLPNRNLSKPHTIFELLSTLRQVIDQKD